MTVKDRLDEDQFTYKTSRDGTLFVYWNGKQVRTYSGNKAVKIIAELEAATSGRDIQYALARVTGNFKRGNEKREG